MNNITFTFHFDLSLTRNLRDSINEKRNLSENKEGQLNNKKNINYLAFDRICAKKMLQYHQLFYGIFRQSNRLYADQLE